MRRRRDDKFPDNGFEAWGGYMNAKKDKLEEQFSSRASKEEAPLSNIFSGVTIFVNGYTIPSADELKALMSRHGGVYHTYQRSDDYIIASNLPDTKVKQMSLTRVVKPEWITDSIAANCLQDYRDYLLYKNSRTQPKLNFKSDVRTAYTGYKSKLSFPNEISTTGDMKHETSGAMARPISPSSIPRIEVSENSDSVNKLPKQNEIIKKNEETKTAAHPNFISEFYSNSRLHHISQLGTCFKQHVNDLRENTNFQFPARTDLKNRIISMGCKNNFSPISFEKDKVIMHIDMDCFFVSVGLRIRPELLGKPVAVTHSKGGHSRSKRPGVDRNAEFGLYKQRLAQKIGKATGQPKDEIEFESRVDGISDENEKFGSMSEIASCSYEARAKGIGNGMFMGTALKLCPDLQTIPYDFEGYKDVAYTMYNTIAQYTLDIEAVSCDEMYVDCTELLKSMNISVQDFATVLRNEIRDKTGCPCSTGFGGNRLQARLATKKAKPNGQFFLTTELVEDFIVDIKLKELPGVGRHISQKLETLGHQTCGSLQGMSLASLKAHLGVKIGAQLFDQCRGRDLNPLSFHTVRKSVSAEVNYGIRFENNDQYVEFLKRLSAEVHARMQQNKVLGKCITLKLMVRAKDAPVETAKFMGHGFCDVINKSVSLNTATNDVEVITREVLALCKNTKHDPKEMRGIGIQITKLEPLNKEIKGTMSRFLTSIPSKKDTTMDQVPVSTNHNKSDNKLKVVVTPRKSKTPSPSKKSPIIGQAKSPSVRRRGRPPKSAKLQMPSINLMTKFLQGQNVRDTPHKDPMINDKKYVTVRQNNIETGESENRVIVFQEETREGLRGFSWEQVRELLRAWLQSGQTPLTCDIEMIADYMKEMVVNKDIDKLDILLNFLRRRTRELNSKDWIEVYNHCVNQIQNAMIAVYGKRLFLED